jgi:hypothetical protein
MSHPLDPWPKPPEKKPEPKASVNHIVEICWLLNLLAIIGALVFIKQTWWSITILMLLFVFIPLRGSVKGRDSNA